MGVIARVLQYVGLTLPPLSILLQLNGTLSVRDMLLMLVAGVAAFWLGRVLEGYVRK